METGVLAPFILHLPALNQSSRFTPKESSHNTDLINPLKAELNFICHLLALLGTYPIFHVSRIKAKYTEGVADMNTDNMAD
jgi:hypothetical protein